MIQLSIYNEFPGIEGYGSRAATIPTGTITEAEIPGISNYPDRYSSFILLFGKLVSRLEDASVNLVPDWVKNTIITDGTLIPPPSVN